MTDTRKKRPLGSTAVDADEAFPRGGSDGLSLLERRRIEIDARASVEEEAAAGADASGDRPAAVKRPKKDKGNAEDAEDTFFKQASSSGNVAKYVELLKFKNLTVGSRVWGAVLEVSPRGLIISLPHGLRGHVAANEASDVLAQLHNPTSKTGAALRQALGEGAPLPSLTDLFNVGQYVRCIVTSVGQSDDAEDKSRKRKVELSLQLRHVCSGLGPEALHEGAAVAAVVRSVEDHGYVLGFGIKGVSGFLLKKDHQAAYGASSTLQPGTLLEVLVTKALAAGSGGSSGGKRGAKSSGHVLVSSALAGVASAVTKEVEGLNLLSLLPGSLVNVRVRTLLSDGLLVSFLTYFHGTIDPFHLVAPPGRTADVGTAISKQYSVGQRLRARILYVNAGEKRVGLSLLPHLQSMTMPSPTPMLGQVFDGAVIKRIDAGLGLLLELPMPPVSCLGHVHVSNTSEERVEKLEAVFKVGQTVKARVIGFRLMDGLATLTMKTAAVNQEIMSFHDLHPGMPVNGVVSAVEDFGLILEIGGARNLKALVPTIHMTDLGTAKGKSKFKVGQSVSGRVLWVSHDKTHKLQVTLKKGLLGSKLPIVASVEDAVKGARAHGVVTGCQPYGVFVSFYNNLRGLLHTKELSLATGQTPEELYSVGQVIKVRVIDVEPQTQRITLGLASAKKEGDATANGTLATTNGASDALGGLQPGDLVQGTVKQIQEINGRLMLLLSVDGAGGARDVPARMEMYQLSDHPAAVEALRGVMEPGAKLGQLLVLERLESQKTLRVTRKAALIQAAPSTPRSLEEVKESALLTGYVANVTGEGVYVRFLGGLTGRAGLSQISDIFVSQPALHFEEGQTVRCQVVGVDADKQRFSVNLKASVVGSADAGYLHTLFRDQEFAERLRCERDGEAYEAWPADLTPGRLIDAVVSKLEPFGTVCDVEGFEDHVGIITPGQLDTPAAATTAATASTTTAPVVATAAAPPTAKAASTAVAAAQPASASSALAPGSRLRPRIVDLIRSSGIVELSLLPEVLSGVDVSHQDEAESGGELTEAAADPSAEATAAITAVPAEAKKKKQKQQKKGSGPAAVAAAPVVPKTARALKKEAAQAKAREAGVATRWPAAEKAEKEANNSVVVVDSGGDGAGKLAPKPKLSKLKVGAPAISVVVDLKAHYAVVVLRELPGAPIAYLALQDFNVPRAENVKRRLVVRQMVPVTIQVLPEASTSGRLLVHTDLHKGIKRQLYNDVSKKEPLVAGALVSATVTSVQPTQLDVVVGRHLVGSVHISQVLDITPATDSMPSQSPLEGYKVTQKLQCVLLARPHGISVDGSYNPGVLELSLKPSLVKAAEAAENKVASLRCVKKLHLSTLHSGQRLVGYVQEVAEDCVWLAIDPRLRGRLDILHMSDDPDKLAEIRKDCQHAFALGAPLAVSVLEVNLHLRQLNLTLIPDEAAVSTAAAAAAKAGANATAAAAAAAAARSAVPLAPGAVVMGCIVQSGGTGLLVHLGWKRSGRVALTDLHDVYVPNALKGFAVGTYVRCKVLTVKHIDGGDDKPEGETQCELSIRPSHGGRVAGVSSKESGPAAPEVLDTRELVEGTKVQGYVRRVDEKGMFLQIDRSTTARVQLRNLSDGFVDSPAAMFPVGTLVEGEVVVPPGAAVGTRVELTLRGSKAARNTNIGALQEGGLYSAKVRRVEPFGVFCDVGSTGVVGLCHISELADGTVRDINKFCRIGQAVRVKVLRINAEDRRVSLGMKLSYTTGPDAEAAAAGAAGSQRDGAGGAGAAPVDIDDEMVDMMDAEAAEEDEDELVEDEEAEEDGEEGGAADSDDDLAALLNGASDDDDEGEEGDEEEGSPEASSQDEGADSDDDDFEAAAAAAAAGGSGRREAARRSLPGATSHTAMDIDAAVPSRAAAAAGTPTWGGLQLLEDVGAPTTADAREDGEGDGAAEVTKKSKGQKKREKEEKERAIKAQEMARLSGDAAPQTAVDFERLIVSSPNSSFVWIKYMAFLIAQGDVEKARATVERALSTIHFREEGEKFNVWVAALNLEAAYGKPDPTTALTTFFARALQYNDQKKLYFALLGICERTDRTELREQTLKAMCKKFATSAKVWLRALQVKLSSGDSDGTRKLLDRAVAALPIRKHIKVITQCALLEFRLGSAERGRGILEGVLRNYPKRLDLWSVYLDQEIKLGDQARTRALFERATHLSLPPKKMKLLFRRFLEYEKAHGDAASVEHVKQRAMEFVASLPH